ncbi:MAG: glycosyltransferase [Rubrivivax sp.]|nr:glycosyltransferase [Rubrivivax sp.]
MARCTVAVVSTVLNERDSIGSLLDSFLSQSRAPDEIVIVDGGSRDGTLDVLRDYQRRHASIKVHIEPGVNIARGRNLAILRTRCELIAVTDGGCRPDPTWLESLVKPLLDDSGIGAVAGHTRIVSTNHFEHFAGLLATSVNVSAEAQHVFHGRNSAFRRSVWAAVGGYPEWLYTAEDTLFCQRAKELGCRVGLADDAVVAWRPRPSLRKLARQYYLYGRGHGRIGRSNLSAVFYHLRNHAVWTLSLAVAVISPWALVVTAATWAFLYRLLVRPAFAEIHGRTDDPTAVIYVPLIVFTRSLCNNLGQLRGTWEHRRVPPFRDNLRRYLAGQWRMAELSDVC